LKKKGKKRAQNEKIKPREEGPRRQPHGVGKNDSTNITNQIQRRLWEAAGKAWRMISAKEKKRGKVGFPEGGDEVKRGGEAVRGGVSEKNQTAGKKFCRHR